MQLAKDGGGKKERLMQKISISQLPTKVGLFLNTLPSRSFSPEPEKQEFFGAMPQPDDGYILKVRYDHNFCVLIRVPDLVLSRNRSEQGGK